MSLTETEVAKVARLSRLAFTPEELPGITAEVNGILGWIEKLQAVNTDGVEPLVSVSGMTLPLREDEVTAGGQAADIVKNAPESMENYFVVPKVVE
ncbi:MAG TPA: Asp-tRNA(Asn)/Glu-tRNA(Gln) amidotransferase subunit GatC [Alphaproteobacteria bacterium]|nr:Asp-tRNA(Asn)/Glu-tRNA(Gln) amidotransferase GatCAB subunit C [Rhodospirillaceae bacterium]HRJ11743.1 Asp-tRNA(Asn)/Glu-tRNA(Gln) amidotransferase subunit GatC [Alphaproteobacteria bacterium]